MTHGKSVNWISIDEAENIPNNIDVYAVNRVRKAYQHIEDTWEDTRARCS